ncbi:hypothetical protein DEU56DRAFT_391877 [Suillus clintonianus]|uniref:uncharacterized protein n=1 Tax=Suillus clintonianus TaxID=1904413 RepID=UPI001B865CFE|nr:uncharacterized protein DEU56DRAFT_391877 [Suillus clintonianus]KAG2135434.1 hypothetical protein DEU56DRAFT_391877 [Suillus clintonianus]
MSTSLGLHIVDPRILSDQVGDVHPPTSLTAPPPRLSPRPSRMASISQDNLYSNLATFTFGEPRTSDSDDESPDAISPLTPITRTGADRTPRPSVSVSTFSSHPSQGPGRPASTTFPSSSRSIRREYTDGESSEDPSSPDLNPSRRFHRSRLIPDNVSQHTFGHPALRYSTASIASSRSSSRASFRSELHFSSDEEVEIASYDGSSSPVTFARDLDNIDENENSPVFHPRPLFEPRRGSLPMAIPGALSDAVSNRSREDSILTIRRPSRSLDDDLLSSHSGEDAAAVVPRSEPLTRADFRSLEAHAVQQQSEPDTWASGWDLSYVLSRKSEGSIRSFRSTAQLSFLAPARNSAGAAELSRLSNMWNGGRRTSTGTLQTTNSGEDTFLKHVGMYDPQNQWSFMKEKADAQPVPTIRRPNAPGTPINMDKAKRTMYPGTQEIWRSGHVGRYRVDRLTFKPASTADPAKAAQQRINVRHIPDPFLKGPKNGPSTVIHKHSRATAFSIFRSYTLFTAKRAGTGSRNIHMHTSGGIMLAPKKVQEQYTSTKTTSKLSTHGLLEDGSRKPIGNGDKSRRGAFEKDKRREKEKEDAKKAKTKAKEKKKDKKNERMSNPTESTESSTATSSTGSISGSQIMPAPARPTMSKITFAPSIMSPRSPTKLQSTSGPSSPETSSTLDHSSKKLLQSDSSTSVVSHIRGHRDSIDSDEHLPTRTPHAEAFGTLDPNDIEHLRRAQKPSDGSSSFANRIFRRFRGTSSRADTNALAAVTPQNAYSPPWIVTAGRDQNEEHVRVLTDLNNSFRDVGLLHTQPHHKVGVKSVAKKRAAHDIFDYVPEDSLYMLLPLWAGETDPGSGGAASSSISASISDASTAATTASTATSATLPTIPEDRQYLLVWYVPFEDKNKNPSTAKKKPKQTHSTSDPNAEANQKNVFLSNFRVNARLVGYDDLRGSGIRLPSDGLAVGVPAWEVNGIGGGQRDREGQSPEPQLGQQQGTALALDPQLPETVICMCSSRDNGFLFQPEGLTKLGLCLQEEVALPAASNPLTVYFSEMETSEMKHSLTPVGRAAVEMVWLGCLAITSFGPYQ